MPLRNSFTVRNFYADLKRHDLGPNFYERNYDTTLQKEFMTEPLWGVGSSAPYGHDGRSINLMEVILRHGGEAQGARNNFARLSSGQAANAAPTLAAGESKRAKIRPAAARCFFE